MAYLDKSAQWSIKKEASYGVVPTFNVVPGEDIVQLINPTMDAATDLLDREILKNSLVKAQPVLGKETSSGSFGIEASSVIANKLNGNVLYESAMGKKIAPAASAVGTTTTTEYTPTTGTDADLFSVGQAVKLSGGVSEEYSVITVITAGTSITLSPAVTADQTLIETAKSAGTTDGDIYTPTLGTDTAIFSVGQAVKLSGGAAVEYAVIRSIVDDTTITYAPTSAVDQTLMEGLTSYVVAKPDVATISFAVEEYFENAANQITYTYAGVVVSDMTITYPIANIVKTDFSVAGAGFDVATAVGDRASVCQTFTPYVAKNMTFTYNDVDYAIEELTTNIASDVYDTEALTTDGITNKTVTGKSSVGGSFGLEYGGTALFTAFQAGTSGELFGTVANAGATSGIYMPNVIISQSSKSVDSGIYKDSADFVALSSPLCSDTIEDAVTIFFG